MLIKVVSFTGGERIARILFIGNPDKPVGIALQGKSGFQPCGNVNGVIIGYHLVKLNLVAVAIIYQPVKAIQFDSFRALRV